MPKNSNEDIVQNEALFPPTEEEKMAIDHFLGHLERVGHQTLGRYKTIPSHMRDKSTNGMIEYWSKAVSAFQWARSINGRRRVKPDA